MFASTRLRWILVTALLALLSMGAGSCDRYGVGTPALFFQAPLLWQVSLVEGVELELSVGHLVDPETLEVTLDGEALDPADFAVTQGEKLLAILPAPKRLQTVLPVLDEGLHALAAKGELDLFFFTIPLEAATFFQTADLERPDECEVLDDSHCVLPFPSSRFLEDVGNASETGLRVNLPFVTLPGVAGPPLDPGPVNVFDGFAPTVQILAHFEGVDPAQSGASRLLAGVPQNPPYVGVRTHDASSLDPGSPTVLIDADTGERVLHWIEVDQTPEALADPTRQVLFLRPAESLVPGHRYIVAYRHLRNGAGETIPPQIGFQALRDRLPTTIDSIESRRDHFEELFDELKHAGVKRHDLQLAFDFQVRSATQLHQQMLSMRDDSMAWLAARAADDVTGFAGVQVDEIGDCSHPGQTIWRVVRGTFAGPNYMDGNINDFTQVSLLNVDANRIPVRNGTFPFNWSVAVPCAVYRGEEVGHPLLLGHGFLGDGAGMVGAFALGGFFGGSSSTTYIAGATDWRGLALGLNGPDALNIVLNVLGTAASGHRFNNFSALPDRLKQGVVNTLVLSRMMKSGYFNRLDAFQRIAGDPTSGVFTPQAEMFYFGVSLGGIYGTMYAALNQDTIRHNVDVPAMNFSLLEQRSTQFPVFLNIIKSLGLTDPMDLAILLQIQHELWVSAEPAAYIRNVTGTVDPPLPNTPPKKMLVTVAFLDKQVSNQATNIFTRSMGIPQLEGSIQLDLPGIPDENADAGSGRPGLDSAMQIYDTGYFDIFDPAYDPYLPPLANLIPSSKCDPHGTARLSIPASVAQLQAFLQPDGRIYNFCDGACDAATPEEQPASACDPLN